MNLKSALVQALKIILTLIVLYFLGRQIVENWSKISTHPWDISWLLIIAAIAMTLVAFMIMTYAWTWMIEGFGKKLSILWAFKIIFMSNLGRYVPGRIWQIFGMIYLAKRKGVTGEEATASFFILQLFAIPSSFLVYFLMSLIDPRISIDSVAKIGQGWIAWLVAISAFIVCLAVVWRTKWFLAIGNFILRKAGRPAVVFAMDKTVALKTFVVYVVGWLAYGAAFWIFLVAVLGVSAAPGLPAAIGMFNAAYQIGYLMLFAPGGFGPRELILGTLLTPFIGPIAPAVAILQRLWTIAGDATAALVSVPIKE